MSLAVMSRTVCSDPECLSDGLPEECTSCAARICSNCALIYIDRWKKQRHLSPTKYICRNCDKEDHRQMMVYLMRQTIRAENQKRIDDEFAAIDSLHNRHVSQDPTFQLAQTVATLTKVVDSMAQRLL